MGVRRKVIVAGSIALSFILVAVVVCCRHPYAVRHVVRSIIPSKTVRYKADCPDYSVLFNDLQNRQIVAAKKYGLREIPKTREDLEVVKEDLVTVCSSRNITLGYMPHSAKLLRPNALDELETIGELFRLKLKAEGLPRYKIVVTSLLRTQEDVDKLRTVNSVATSKSCHSYGTTFDISYASFDRLSIRLKSPSEDLKVILAEVLKDEKQSGNIYVKHEVSQNCFHITCRR